MSIDAGREPTLPHDAQASEKPTRKLPYWAKALIVVSGLAVLTPLVGIGLVTAHAAFTPRFEEYVRSTPVDASVLIPPTGAAVLASGPSWFAAERDPFGVEPPERNELRQSFVVKHGDAVLLDLRQTLAYTWNDDFSERESFGGRTDVLRTGENLHAIVRVHVAGVDTLVGAGSLRTGRVTFDVWLVAGAGPNDVHWLEGDPETPFESGAGSLGGTNDSAFAAFAETFHPAPTLPSCGLAHHMRRTLILTAARHAGGAESTGWGELEHSVTTGEYSYTVESGFEREEGGGKSSSSESKSLSKTLNGQVW